MKKRIAQNAKNSECTTKSLSDLDWSNWYDSDAGVMVKAEKGNKYHLVSPKHCAAAVGMRNGALIWVSET